MAKYALLTDKKDNHIHTLITTADVGGSRWSPWDFDENDLIRHSKMSPMPIEDLKKARYGWHIFLDGPNADEEITKTLSEWNAPKNVILMIKMGVTDKWIKGEPNDPISDDHMY